jgi:DNA-binding IclR family transcriptional regulator
MRRIKSNSDITRSSSNPDNDRIMFNSIFRAVRILTCLSEGISNLTDIASHCQLSNSTVHRLLKTLEKTHLVMYTPFDHRYHLGPLVCQLSSNPRTAHEILITCAADEMKRLADISEETVSLDIVMGIESILLYQIQSKHKLKITDDVKSTTKLIPVGSTCKVLLSQFNDEELRLIIKNITWQSLVGNTGVNKDILVAELKRIKEQGYAISHGERITGALGISTPIKNYTQPAALSITGYDSRLLPKISGLIEELKTSTSRVSNSIAEFFT